MTGHPKMIRINSREDSATSDEVRCPAVGVIMSTYNGVRYLQKQVYSIAVQKNVSIEMFTRDDGSADGTPDLLRDLSSSPCGSITAWRIEYGRNLGFFESFERLLLTADGCDFYAFSDQDDFWLTEKLSRAIAAISGARGPALYASSVTIANERLEPIGENMFPGLAYTIPAELIRHRLAGHTMVWNAALQERIMDFGPLPCWSHDQQVVLAALLCGAGLWMDDTSYVLHRRLSSSVTPGGAGLSKRIRHEMGMLWNKGHRWDRGALASTILVLTGVSLSESDRRFLRKCADHKRFSLAFDPAFGCGLPAGDAEARLSVLLGRF